MNDSSLFEMLGILIGFAGIMLVLSLVATALTQMIVHLFGLRKQILKDGLTKLLATAWKQRVRPELVQASKELAVRHAEMERTQAVVKALADANISGDKAAEAVTNAAKAKKAHDEAQAARDELIGTTTPAGATTPARTTAPQSDDASSKIVTKAKEMAANIVESNALMRTEGSRWIKPFQAKASWILKEELETLLYEVCQKGDELSTEVVEKAMFWFSRMERGLSQRFCVITRYLTIACAVIVALVLQVNALTVLNRLSADPAFRAQAEKMAVDLLPDYETKYADQGSYEDVAAEALLELQKKYPKVEEIEQVSGIGEGTTDTLEELSRILETNPDREAISSDYEKLVAKVHQERYDEAVSRFKEGMSILAKFDLKPFSGGVAFYRSPANWLGLLITVIFLSLGAPFWFNALRGLVNLRDTLAPKEDKKADKTSGK
ncbi:MAG: hypothetical protein ACYS8I_08700 [Planctomycetota bacterium]|jgi:hypothetical protein